MWKNFSNEWIPNINNSFYEYGNLLKDKNSTWKSLTIKPIEWMNYKFLRKININ